MHDKDLYDEYRMKLEYEKWDNFDKWDIKKIWPDRFHEIEHDRKDYELQVIEQLNEEVDKLKAEVKRLRKSLRKYERTIQYVKKAYRFFPAVRQAVLNLKLVLKLTINAMPEKKK